MNTDNLTNELIGRYIPNILTEVEGEIPLAEKLAPFIESATLWLETEYLGPDDFLSESHNELALKIIVKKALADAVPSLDLIITPNGMAVINTDNMAPASKERVERLVASLRDYVRVNVALLLDICRTYEAWRRSERGRYFGASFINSPSDYNDVPALKDFSYDEIRSLCIIAEGELADRYLGRVLMNTLRHDYNCCKIKQDHPLVSMIRAAILNLIEHLKTGRMYDPNILWHASRPIIAGLSYFPGYKELWDAEMGDKSDDKFTNDVKGGFYF